MILARLRFSKGEELKYISHLDLQRMFHRILRRARVDVTFSKGFNPHPKVSFAMAMPVGMTSEGEYVDIELNSYIDGITLKDRVNKYSPLGFEITDVKITNKPSKSLSSVINKGIYFIEVPMIINATLSEIEDVINILLTKDKIVIKKTNKKGKQIEKDVKNMMYNIKPLCIAGKTVLFKMILATGSMENLKPLDVLYCINNISNMFLVNPLVRIHRINLLTDNDLNPIDILDVI